MRVQRVPRDIGISEVTDLLANELKTREGCGERIIVICSSEVEDHLREISNHVIFLNPSSRVSVEDLEANAARVGADRLVVNA